VNPIKCQQMVLPVWYNPVSNTVVVRQSTRHVPATNFSFSTAFDGQITGRLQHSRPSSYSIIIFLQNVSFDHLLLVEEVILWGSHAIHNAINIFSLLHQYIVAKTHIYIHTYTST